MRTPLKIALALILWAIPTPVSIEVNPVTIIMLPGTAALHSCLSHREGWRDFSRMVARAGRHAAHDGDFL